MRLPDRLLMPVFGTATIREMFPAMEDVISQLVAKWERWISPQPTSDNHETDGASYRFGSEHVIDPTLDYTKLTLDAISLASMSYRMNSFYTVRSPLLMYLTVLILTTGGCGAVCGCNRQVSHGMPVAIRSAAPLNRGDDQHPSPV